MDEQTIRRLVALNNDFYRTNADTFTRSRRSSWPGWERVCAHMPFTGLKCSLLDAACGNLRFERYLIERYPAIEFAFTCIDSCAALLEDALGTTFHEADLIEGLLQGEPLYAPDTSFDAAVSFGFMHHIPTQQLRCAFMRNMLACLKPGGVCAVSFWRFLTDDQLAQRAVETTREGVRLLGFELEEGDCLVGWNSQTQAFRYCHSFSSQDVADIVESVADMAECLEVFDSDGRTKSLNRYLVFRRHG